MAFTQEQIDAIESKGKVIVSASAGSGKTTVMIEKMIRLILSGTDVSDVLAVTFTKKAASQMKEKLKTNLIKTLNEKELTEESRRNLKEQLVKVSTADISTIHSFCSTLIRTHFFDAGVSGDFKIIAGDDAESVALKVRALDKVFEEAYAEDETGDFFKLLSVYWRKKSDKTFKEIVLKIYAKIRDRADYRVALESSGGYTDEDFSRIERELFTFLKKKCEYYATCAEEYEYYFKTHDGEPSAVLAGEVKDAFKKIADAPDFFTATLTGKAQFSTKEKTSKRPKEYVEKLSELICLRDKKYGEILKYLSKFRSREEEKNAFFESGEIARALGLYILKFDDEYSALKREKNLLDYNDLEHVTLKLLQNEKVLTEIHERYKHVFVDEYQDVNPVQEKIISLVSGENVFLVGDVKQAIYGFRGSKSRYFGEKQAEFSDTGGLSLKLSRNFRSSDVVLDAVNSLFCAVMTKETSDVDYINGSVMEKGGRYPTNSGKVVAHILSTEEEKEEKKAASKDTKKRELPIYSVREASKNIRKENLKTAQAIKEIIDAELGSEFFDVEKERFRKVEYSDIVVLSRKKQGEIKDVALALSDAGVPISSAAAVNICEYSEVKLLIDILKLLDNERQDEPLVSALLSPMGRLTTDELAQIRIAYKQEKFFRDACKKFAVETKNSIAAKLQKFYALYSKLRALAAVVPVGEVLNELFAQTEMESEILSRENGVLCLKRVRRFVAESVTPEALALHDFLVRLKNLDYKIPYSESGGENSVQILTMHSSKGLEYPVVIVDATGKFRGAEHAEVVMDEEYGLAPRFYDREKMIKHSTLLRELYDVKKRRDEVGDELNLYYVALTRAKYAAHVLFKEKPVLKNVLYANSFAELTDFSVWGKYLSYGVEEELVKQDREIEEGPIDESLVEKIVQAYGYKYPYSGVEDLPVKSSATSIMDEMETLKTEAYTAYELFDEQDEQEKELGAGKTSKEAGIAYHAFLEKFDFDLISKGAGSRDSLFSVVEKTLTDWTERGVLPKEQLALLSAEKLTGILLNPVFLSLVGMTLYKEQQFLVSLPIKDIPAFRARVEAENENVPLDEELLFQGAIDLLAIGGDGNARIIDYKYSIKDEREIKEKYAPQLDLYRKATARILKTDEKQIKCSIVNLYRGFEVSFD